MNELHPAKE